MQLEVKTVLSYQVHLGSIIFVHGVTHGAWCWENYTRYFSKKGYDCYALSLRGHGKSEGREHLNEYGLEDYAQDVLQVISTIKEKPILIGHSMGGAIVQKVIGEHPDLVLAAILLASAQAGGCGNPIDQLKYYFYDFSGISVCRKIMSGKKATPEQIKKSLFFCGRVPLEEIKKFSELFCAESTKAMNDLFKPYTQNYQNVNLPVLVIGSSKDKIFTEKCQRVTAACYGVKPVILPNLCHDMMLDPEWEKSAAKIADFLAKNSPATIH